MSSKYWIKLYHEILDDPKMGKLSDRLWRRTIELFLMAGDYDADGELPSVEDISWRLRLSNEELETDLADLASVGIVHRSGNDWIVTKFSDRQRAATGTERWQRWQERQRKDNYYQTDDQRNPNDTLSDIDKDIDIDSDIDKEEESESTGIYADLSAAFVNYTGIPELSPNPRKWFEALDKLGKAGVTVQDIESAVDVLRDKDYSIVGLSSITNTAISEMSKRLGKNKVLTGEQRQKYSQWDTQ